MQKKQLTLVIVSLLVVVLSVSLAWFTTQILGKGKDVSVTSANLQIIFNDTGGEISATDIEPGWSISKEFTIKNDSNASYKYNIVIQNLVNTFTLDYLKYKVTSTNGYSMTDYADVPKSATATDTVLAENISIAKGVTQTYTIEFKYENSTTVDQSADMGKKLSGTLFITQGIEEKFTGYNDDTLGAKILEDNSTISERTDFSTAFTETTTGKLYKSTESIVGSNPIDVYYYAGNTTNNWVKFAGFYWRIMRTNHDGSIRLLYVGTSHDTTSANIGKSKFNENYDSPKYFGYKYGEDDSTLDGIRENTTDSTIKTTLDAWYANNMISYTKYLSSKAVYCNDRNLGTAQTYDVESEFLFSSYNRLDEGSNTPSVNPTYNCTNIKDSFSVDNTEAELTYPIGLITIDELIFIGKSFTVRSTGSWIDNSSTGNLSNSFWTMTSHMYKSMSTLEGIKMVANIIALDGERGMIASTKVNSSAMTVRPVTSLKSCVKYSSGDGTAENPYTIEETESGC